MKISAERVGQTLVVRCQGELDLHTAIQFRTEVERELERYSAVTNLVLNLDGVSFVDSSGLGVILGRYKHVRQRGGKMVLTRLQPQVHRLFELAGLLKIMPVRTTEAEALHLA